MTNDIKKIVLAGGCFWCVEAVFKRLKGVSSVRPGYAGGIIDNPSYEQVSNGNTGYAEVIEIEYDPEIISLETLLQIFWAVHDPTTLNRQGADVGTQYRSAIFYFDQQQKEIVQRSLAELSQSGKFSNEIVTEIIPISKFYPAEENHRDFYDNNREYGYCRVIIDPKIQKLYKTFKEQIKENFEN